MFHKDDSTKILYIWYKCSPEEKAALCHVSGVVKAFRKKDIKVKLLLQGPTNEEEINRTHAEKVPVIRIRYLTWLSWIILTLYGLFSIISFRPKLIYFRFAPFPGLISAIGLLAKLTGVFMLVELNGIYLDECKNNDLNLSRWQKIRVILAEKLMCRFSDLIVTVTKGISDYLKHTYGVEDANLCTAPNGVDIDLFKPLSFKAMRKRLQLNPHEKIICFVGTLNKLRGVDLAIESVGLLSKSIPSIRFLIVGDGEFRSKLEQKVNSKKYKRNIIFCGRVEHTNVPEYISSSDVCVAPFRIGLKSGYSPLKLYEYAACAKPTVITKIDENVSQFIQNSGGGVLCNVTPESLADAIAELLLHPDKAEKMGANAREYVVKNHSWNAVTEQILNEIRKE